MPDLRMSKVRCEKTIFINPDPQKQSVPQLMLSKDLNSKVGGFFGFGKTWSNSQVTLEKDIFTVGETIRVIINCDNSGCSKAV